MNKELKHLKNNKQEIDYILVNDKTLKEQEYKNLLDIKVNENQTLNDLLKNIDKSFAFQLVVNDELRQKNNELMKELEDLKRRLASR